MCAQQLHRIQVISCKCFEDYRLQDIHYVQRFHARNVSLHYHAAGGLPPFPGGYSLNLTAKSLHAYLTPMEDPYEDDFMISDDIDDPEIVMLTELGTTLINAILEKEPISNVRDLIDAGAPLWYQDEEGTSVLHAAVCVENEQLVKLLIEEGAVWNAGAADAHSTTASVD